MKTSTMGIIVGSSALASAGMVKMSKGYQRKKYMMERQNEQYRPMQEMKQGLKQSVKTGTEKTTDLVKTGTEKTTDLVKTGVEAEEEMLKTGIDKTIEGVKSGIEAQQRMMEREKEMLDKVNESIQRKEMTMGVVVGSTALLTTGLVLALNAYQKKHEEVSHDQTETTTLKKLEGGLKTGTSKAIDSVKSVINLNQKMMEKEKKALDKADESVQSSSGETNKKFIPDSEVSQAKDVKSTQDPERDSAYKGLTELDTQYRDEWQANGLPQTHTKMDSFGEKQENENSESDNSVLAKTEELKNKVEKNNAK